MYLLDTELEYYDVSPADIEKMNKEKTKYVTLDAKRKARFNKRHEDKKVLVTQAKKEHDESMQYLENTIKCQVPLLEATLSNAAKFVFDCFVLNPKDFDMYFKVNSPEFTESLNYLVRSNRGTIPCSLFVHCVYC